MVGHTERRRPDDPHAVAARDGHEPLLALGAALWATPGGQALVQLLGARTDDMLSWFTALFAPRTGSS